MMQNFLIIMGSLIVVAVSPALALVGQTKPQVGEVALVIALPWGADPARIAANAGAQEVSPERAPMGVLIMLNTEQTLDQLYAQGAWLVVDGRKVLELCVN